MEVLNLLEKYGDKYLVIEFNNMFLTENILDEMMVYLSDKQLEEAIVSAERQINEVFKISSYRRDKLLSKYSGGEKSLICFAVVSSIIKVKSLFSVEILLVNLIESLSKENCSVIIKEIKGLRDECLVDFFCLKKNEIMPVLCD